MSVTEKAPAAATASGTERDLERIAELARRHELSVATAESLTSGAVASTLGAGPSASQWFCGGVVAYHSRVKFEVVGVEEGPVITESCARQLAEGAARLLGADVVVSTTGAGGPDPEEGEPAGTVYLAVTLRGDTLCERAEFDGEPEDVVEQTVQRAVRMLRSALEGLERG